MRRKHCAAFVMLHPVRTRRTQEFTNVVFYTGVYKYRLLRSENKINIFHDRQNRSPPNNVVNTLVRRIRVTPEHSKVLQSLLDIFDLRSLNLRFLISHHFQD